MKRRISELGNQASQDFWTVYSGEFDEMQRVLLASLVEHPTFGPLLAAQSETQREQETATGKARLRRAFEHGEWGPYEENLAVQGAHYAALKVPFSEWYDIIRLGRVFLIPRFVEAYSSEPERLAAAIMFQAAFFDDAMATIGEAYIAYSEASLRASKLRLSTTLQCIGEAVIATDAQGVVERINRAAEELLGWHSVEVVGKKLGEVIQVEDEATGERFLKFAETESSEAALLQEGKLICANDARVPIVATTAPNIDTSGSVAGAVIVLRDLSPERARAEERAAARAHIAQIEQSSRSIQEASRLKSEFLANMSHELRTPLNSIIGFAELLHAGKVGPVEPQQEEFLGDILSSGRHLLQLINDILDLSKVEAGKMEFYPEEIDLKQIVGEVCSILRTAANKRQVRVIVDVAEDIGTVTADASRLKQILYNYVSNSLKFCTEGTVVDVRVTADGDAFLLEVEDRSDGIAPEDLSLLFREFRQLQGGAAKRHSGTGLGLALVKRLVEAQGGRVGVRSALGEGSVFFARLPRHIESEGSMRAIGTHVSSGDGHKKMRVLIVEDDAADQTTISHMLTDAGFTVDLAGTGATAIQMAGERAYDAVTLDLLLPDMNGLEVLRELRAGKRNNAPPAVVISIVTENVTSGLVVNGVLSKPINREALLGALLDIEINNQDAAVLVVDDDPRALRLMTQVLESLGYRADCHDKAEDALAAAAAEAPMAVILDLMMPEVDGFEFLVRFRAEPSFRDVPVLVWTTKDLSSDELNRFRVSAQGVTQKGSAIIELTTVLRALLPARRKQHE